MITILLTMLLAQGIPALPGESGTVSGVLHTAAGDPAAGVRVSAMVPPESVAEAASAASFVALAQTDEQGRYSLQGIPAGRYYIVAGRVDLPTYYPGTIDLTKARIFAIPPGGTVSGIDFVMMDNSVRTASSFDTIGVRLPAAAPIMIPIRVVVEDGAKLPVYASGGFTQVQFTERNSGSQRTQSIKTSLTFTVPPSLSSSPEYRVNVVNLPEGYIVKSMMYGANDVTTSVLKIPPELIPRPAVVTVAGITQQVVASVPPAGGAAPELKITLATVPVSSARGVRVTGRTNDNEARSVYLSGIPGTLYSDGTFEFRDVVPGRYNLAALGNPPAISSLAAPIVVGDRDMEGVELQVTPALPLDVRQPAEPGSSPNMLQVPCFPFLRLEDAL